jgi:hypothetical protein
MEGHAEELGWVEHEALDELERGYGGNLGDCGRRSEEGKGEDPIPAGAGASEEAIVLDFFLVID